MDGKKLRRSHDWAHGQEGIGIVSAWAAANRLVLGQRQVDDKSNEITAIPPLLEALDITGCFEGFEDTEYADAIYDSYKQVTEGHGRREIRYCWVVTHPDYYCAYLRRAPAWPRLSSLMKLMTVRIIGTKTEVTTRYFISSWQASA